MNTEISSTGKQLRTEITKEGKLLLTLVDVDTPDPGPDEVLVRVQAAPINPSDLLMIFGLADMTTAVADGTAANPRVTADVPPAFMGAMSARTGQSLPCGNEGAGIVVKAGSSPQAQSLVGKTVSLLSGSTYSQYNLLSAQQVLVLSASTTAKEGASCFVNPLTALGMVETMRMEGHKALVHTAAASNLGRMLIKICQADRVDLINIVRRDEHVKLLKDLGATYVFNSTTSSFMHDLTAALEKTGATIAFDATGGGKLAGRILTAMEHALNKSAPAYSRYGSTTHKQVYVYGGLDRSATEFNRSFGMAWSVGGWLLPYFLEKAGQETTIKLRARVADEIKTTFASHYSKEIALQEMVSLQAIQEYGQQATGNKYLVCPEK